MSCASKKVVTYYNIMRYSLMCMINNYVHLPLVADRNIIESVLTPTLELR